MGDGYNCPIRVHRDGQPSRAAPTTTIGITHRTPVNTLTIKGDWNIAKGKLKQKYAKLTDNDLRYVDGKADELVGRLEKATGAGRNEIERFLNDEQSYK
jgi:uncharacterized protein YjbJ (UPF0337 family)